MKKILLYAICLLAFAACRKEKKDHTEELLKLPLELLTAQAWILEAGLHHTARFIAMYHH
ncbi:hypothetical protein [Paraflavitalea pollutisoli]|uniref:hypothetical protein n=1 Tax=Paraflavitalea pollutisoli TaxID=3034143 RepID=UPI0023EC3E29|nr:hypothetical protein [Paraflavitalea sp. H1-2-19X]